MSRSFLHISQKNAKICIQAKSKERWWVHIKKWEVAPLDRERAAQLAERCSIPFFLAMLLEIRGFSSEAAVADLLSG